MYRFGHCRSFFQCKLGAELWAARPPNVSMFVLFSLSMSSLLQVSPCIWITSFVSNGLQLRKKQTFLEPVRSCIRICEPYATPSSMGHPLSHSMQGVTHNINLVSMVPCGVPPLPHNTSQTPFYPVLRAPSLVSSHLILCSLTFSRRPDEAASVWRQRKLVYHNLGDICFDSAVWR